MPVTVSEVVRSSVLTKREIVGRLETELVLGNRAPLLEVAGIYPVKLEEKMREASDNIMSMNLKDVLFLFTTSYPSQGKGFVQRR